MPRLDANPLDLISDAADLVGVLARGPVLEGVAESVTRNALASSDSSSSGRIDGTPDFCRSRTPNGVLAKDVHFGESNLALTRDRFVCVILTPMSRPRGYPGRGSDWGAAGLRTALLPKWVSDKFNDSTDRSWRMKLAAHSLRPRKVRTRSNSVSSSRLKARSRGGDPM